MTEQNEKTINEQIEEFEVCPRCGSPDIDVVMGDYNPDFDHWRCPDCDFSYDQYIGEEE